MTKAMIAVALLLAIGTTAARADGFYRENCGWQFSPGYGFTWVCQDRRGDHHDRRGDRYWDRRDHDWDHDWRDGRR